MANLPSESEFNAAGVSEGNFKTKLSQTISYLRGLLGDSGLAADARIALGLANAPVNYNQRGDWVTARAYAVNDLAIQSGIAYVCRIAHTSGTFATDNAAGKWGVHQGVTTELLDVQAASRAKLHTLTAKMAAGVAIKIACYGDSTTDGNYTTGHALNPVDGSGNAIGNSNHESTAPNSWPIKLKYLLREMFGNAGLDVWNAGYSGKRMDNGWALANYDAAVTNNPYYGTPDACIIAFGLNDVAISGSQITDHATQTRALCKKLLDAGTLPVLMTCDAIWSLSGRDHKEVSRQIDDLKRSIGDEMGVPVLDISMLQREWLERNLDGHRWVEDQPDGLHLQDKGHAFKASAIAAWLFRDTVEYDGVAPHQIPLTDSRATRTVDYVSTDTNMRAGASFYGTVAAGTVMATVWVFNRHPDTELIYRGLNGEGFDNTVFTQPPKIKITEYIVGSTVAEKTPAGAGAQDMINSLSELPYRIAVLPYGLCKIEYIAGNDTSGAHWLGAFELWRTIRGTRAYSDCLGIGAYQSVGGPIAEVELLPERADGSNVFGLCLGEYVDVFAEVSLGTRAGLVIAHCNSWGGSPAREYGSKGFLYILRGITDITYVGAGNVRPDGTISVSVIGTVPDIDLSMRTRFRVRLYRDGATRYIKVFSGWDFAATATTFTLDSTGVCIPVAGAVGGVYFEPEASVYRQSTIHQLYKRQGVLATDVSAGVAPPPGSSALTLESLPSASNLDAMTGSRFFGFSNTATGAPAGTYDALGYQLSGTGQKTQFAFIGDYEHWTRTDDGSGYGGWYQYAFQKTDVTFGKISAVSTSDWGFTYCYANSSASRSLVNNSARGTEAAPAKILAGDRLAGWIARGHNGTAWHTNFGVGIQMHAAEDGDLGNGTYMSFHTATKGADTSRVTVGRATEDGAWLFKQAAPTAVNATATLTAAQLLGRLITSTPTANATLTLPTGTLMDAAFVSLSTDLALDWTLINLAGATYTATVAAGTGHTVVGNMVVAVNSSATFRTRKTAANTFITYRVA